MEIMGILNLIFGGTSLVAIISFFIFFKFSKRGKKAEVEGQEEETEAKNIMNENNKIELGDRYLQSIVKLEDTFKSNTTAVNDLADKIDKVLMEQIKQARLIEYMRLYLDGPFDEWMKNNQLKENNI